MFFIYVTVRVAKQLIFEQSGQSHSLVKPNRLLECDFEDQRDPSQTREVRQSKS